LCTMEGALSQKVSRDSNNLLTGIKQIDRRRVGSDEMMPQRLIMSASDSISESESTKNTRNTQRSRAQAIHHLRLSYHRSMPHELQCAVLCSQKAEAAENDAANHHQTPRNIGHHDE
jgi:hypothetical protein